MKIKFSKFTLIFKKKRKGLTGKVGLGVTLKRSAVSYGFKVFLTFKSNHTSNSQIHL